MESRVAKLESDVGHIMTTLADIKQDLRELRADSKNQFYILGGGGIGAAIGLAWLIAHSAGWI